MIRLLIFLSSKFTVPASAVILLALVFFIGLNLVCGLSRILGVIFVLFKMILQIGFKFLF